MKRFFDISSGEKTDSNLTELLAAQSAEFGYLSHGDWLSHAHRYGYVLKFIQKHAVKTVFDAGCGMASQCAYFLWRNRGHLADGGHYWAADLRASEAWLEKIGWKDDMTFLKMDLANDDPSVVEGWPGQHDLVISFEVLEHMSRENGVKFLQRLFDWTVPGGTCLISTPNAGVSDTTADNHKDPVTGESREWEYQEKLDILDEIGFNLVESFGTFCGTTRLPEDFQEKMLNDPFLVQAKKFLTHGMFVSLVAAAYPQHANNAMFHLVRPA